MVNLRILSLECIWTDDSTEEIVFDVDSIDEPFLRVDNKTIWTGQMDMGDKHNLSDLEGIPFEGEVKVELWERDPGYEIEEDDLLGRVVISDSEIGAERIKYKFETKRARYIMEYRVE